MKAGLVGDADVVGIDRDPLVIAIASEHPLDVGTRRRPRFLVGTAEDFHDVGNFDFVYTRFLLTHLTDPQTVLRSLVVGCPPGATIAVEDIDFAAHVCDPPSTAFDRFVELLRSVGLVDVESTALLPRFTQGEGRLIAYLTFVQIQPSLVALGLADQSELSAIGTELRRLGDDGWLMMSVAGIVQAWGGIPAR